MWRAGQTQMATEDTDTLVEYSVLSRGQWFGALKNQVQHFWEIMLHGKNLRAIEY
jgi:hypothetical protein